MKGIFSVAIAAGLLAGAAFTTAPAQAADVRVTVGQGPVVAYGYNDGYWDREHRWHHWRNHEEMVRWREANREHFFERKHNAERNMGWRNERWWETH